MGIKRNFNYRAANKIVRGGYLPKERIRTMFKESMRKNLKGMDIELLYWMEEALVEEIKKREFEGVQDGR